MKKITFILLLALPAVVNAQMSTFKLTGKVGSLQAPAKVFLIYGQDDTQIVDSVNLTNGVFSFHGSIKEPTQAEVILSHDGKALKDIQKIDALFFYLDKGTLEIKGEDSISKATLGNSKINRDYQQYLSSMAPVNKKSDEFNKAYYSASEAQHNSIPFERDMHRRDSLINAERNATLLIFIQKNPDSQLSLNILQEYAGQSPNAHQIDALFNGLSNTVKASYSGKNYGFYLTGLRQTAIGSTAHNFIQTDTSGHPVTLASFRGKYVLVDFWASWCGPCRQENPNLVSLYALYRSKGFEIIGVSLDHAKTNWMLAIDEDHLVWPQVSDLRSWKNEVALLYAVKAIPRNYLIDPNGKIIATNLRGAALAQKLTEIFEGR